nr:MAG TPA: hypothetical protein [Caudoviricetes sp.]
MRGTPHHRLHQSPTCHTSMTSYRASSVTKYDISLIFYSVRMSL